MPTRSLAVRPLRPTARPVPPARLDFRHRPLLLGQLPLLVALVVGGLRRVLLTLAKRADGRIFHGPWGRLKPDTVRITLMRDVIEPLKSRFPTPSGEIGFENGRVHSFRQYFCSQAFQSGAAEVDVKEWLGHKDSKMVAHYRHLRSEDSQRKMQQIDFLGLSNRIVRSEGQG